LLFLVKKSELKGSIDIPGNKSGTARSIVFGALADGVSRIRNPLLNIDSFSIIKMFRAMGAEIDTSDPKEWVIRGVGGKLKQPAQVLDAENSGTGFYFALACASLIENWTALTGDYQICYRPAQPMIDAINAMGGQAFSTRNSGTAPIIVKGRIKGGEFSMPGVNSQWMTPFLAACALAEGNTVIHEKNLLERPYVDMTIGMLKLAGVKVENLDYDEFRIPGGQSYKAFDYTLPADWGSSGYPLVAAAITEGSKVLFNGLDDRDFAGEKAYVDILKAMGATIQVVDGGRGGITVEGGAELHGIEIDCSGTPDAVPALAVLGCRAKGKTVLYNIGACRLKETDRAKSIMAELTKMGARLEETSDTLTIHYSDLKGAFIDGRHDHRIVMATSIAAMAAEGPSVITDAEFAGVSFPNYYESMKALGASIDRLQAV
jgi:3-phosphoshikimate 1-carboxyvinyltransferase